MATQLLFKQTSETNKVSALSKYVRRCCTHAEPTPHGGKRRANILFSVTGASVWVRARVCGQCFQPGRCSRSKQSRSRFHGGNAGARDSGTASVEQMQILLIEQLKNNDGSYFCELKARGVLWVQCT